MGDMADGDQTATPRQGSGADLSRRMDAMEKKHDDLAKDVSTLTTTVARVEANQTHATELSRLRFDALDAGVHGVQLQLGDFMKRIEGIMSGEVETSQGRAGRELVADYQAWRKGIDSAIGQDFRAWRGHVDSELSRLSDLHEEEDAANRERSRIASITNRSLATVVVVANFILALVVVITNLLSQ